jgi:hypothetical protein
VSAHWKVWSVHRVGVMRAEWDSRCDSFEGFLPLKGVENRNYKISFTILKRSMQLTPILSFTLSYARHGLVDTRPESVSSAWSSAFDEFNQFVADLRTSRSVWRSLSCRVRFTVCVVSYVGSAPGELLTKCIKTLRVRPSCLSKEGVDAYQCWLGHCKAVAQHVPMVCNFADSSEFRLREKFSRNIKGIVEYSPSNSYCSQNDLQQTARTIHTSYKTSWWSSVSGGQTDCIRVIWDIRKTYKCFDFQNVLTFMLSQPFITIKGNKRL